MFGPKRQRLSTLLVGEKRSMVLNTITGSVKLRSTDSPTSPPQETQPNLITKNLIRAKHLFTTPFLNRCILQHCNPSDVINLYNAFLPYQDDFDQFPQCIFGMNRSIDALEISSMQFFNSRLNDKTDILVRTPNNTTELAICADKNIGCLIQQYTEANINTIVTYTTLLRNCIYKKDQAILILSDHQEIQLWKNAFASSSFGNAVEFWTHRDQIVDCLERRLVFVSYNVLNSRMKKSEMYSEIATGVTLNEVYIYSRLNTAFSVLNLHPWTLVVCREGERFLRETSRTFQTLSAIKRKYTIMSVDGIPFENEPLREIDTIMSILTQVSNPRLYLPYTQHHIGTPSYRIRSYLPRNVFKHINVKFFLENCGPLDESEHIACYIESYIQNLLPKISYEQWEPYKEEFKPLTSNKIDTMYSYLVDASLVNLVNRMKCILKVLPNSFRSIVDLPQSGIEFIHSVIEGQTPSLPVSTSPPAKIRRALEIIEKIPTIDKIVIVCTSECVYNVVVKYIPSCLKYSGQQTLKAFKDDKHQFLFVTFSNVGKFDLSVANHAILLDIGPFVNSISRLEDVLLREFQKKDIHIYLLVTTTDFECDAYKNREASVIESVYIFMGMFPINYFSESYSTRLVKLRTVVNKALRQRRGCV